MLFVVTLDVLFVVINFRSRTHAHNHIALAAAAMDSYFGVSSLHQHRIDAELLYDQRAGLQMSSSVEFGSKAPL